MSTRIYKNIAVSIALNIIYNLTERIAKMEFIPQYVIKVLEMLLSWYFSYFFYYFYRACECLDAPEPTTQAPTEAPVNCNAGWIADNYCDDINNNPECEFDGGDCCQEDPADGWNNYCE